MHTIPNHTELSIFPIGNGNGCYNRNEPVDDSSSDDDIEFVLPTFQVFDEERAGRAVAMPAAKDTVPPNESESLLARLQKQTHLEELTITERRRSYDAKGNVYFKHSLHTSNGSGLDVLSPPSHGTDSCSDAEDTTPHGVTDEPSANPENNLVTVNWNGLPSSSNGSPAIGCSQRARVGRRRTRKTISSDDPAEALTEMSVRGLNLFRYATVNAGLYQCMECSKEGTQKTFKNKYSFQRHAFLYHEGKQRKVFPCPVCGKEFSRPDKMKNHWRMTHVSYGAKDDPAPHNSSFLPNAPKVDLVQLHLHLKQHQLHQQQQQPQNAPDEPQEPHGERDKRHQQEQDVLKIRQAVNAITLRQLQQIRFQQQANEPERQQQPLQPQQLAELGQRKISTSNLEPSVPSQLIVLNGVGRH